MSRGARWRIAERLRYRLHCPHAELDPLAFSQTLRRADLARARRDGANVAGPPDERRQAQETAAPPNPLARTIPGRARGERS